MNEVTQEEVKNRFYYKNGNLYYKIVIGNNIMTSGDRAGGLGYNGRSYIQINGKKFLKHRLIFLYHHGYLPREIDHINRDNSDNRIENLRECASSRNHMNSKNRRRGSNYKGVMFLTDTPRIKPWKAQIRINGHAKYLGVFRTELEAAAVYDRAALKFFGEFANVNGVGQNDK